MHHGVSEIKKKKVEPNNKLNYYCYSLAVQEISKNLSKLSRFFAGILGLFSLHSMCSSLLSCCADQLRM